MAAFPVLSQEELTHYIPWYNWNESSSLKSDEHKVRNVAGHCMFYARTDELLWERYEKRAHVLMMLRDEGSFCFPGGVVDPGEDVLTGINRELAEEINLDIRKYGVRPEDFVCAHLYEGHRNLGDLELHFYAKEVTSDDIRDIERNALDAEEYGIETNGVIRVPMHTRNDRGLPLFLANHFAGYSKNQLLYTLVQKNIFSSDEVEKALEASKKHFKA